MAKAGTKTTDEDEDQTAGTETEADEDEDQTAGTETGVVDEDDDDPEAAEAAILAALPPEAVALFEKNRERLAKANASSSNRRKIIQQMRAAGKTTSVGGPVKPKAPVKTGEQAAAFDPEAFKAELLATLGQQQQASTVQTKAERALKAAGLNLPEGEAGDRKLERIMRMVDWSNVAPDEVADEVDDLKRENPELFGRRKTTRPRTGGVGGPAVIKGGAAKTGVDDLFD